jgi:hypothetical protein
MAIKDKSEMSSEITIDLTGPEGNAFVLLGYAKRFAKQLGMSGAKAERIVYEMQSGDYENLLDVFDKHFGSFVTLYR